MPINTLPEWADSRFDTSVPHSARVWNYWLGGKDNYAADRQAGDEYAAIFPRITYIARSSRYFLARVVRYLAADAGIRQFLDIGTGLPTVDNTHEVAQSVAPRSRIVYADNDPVVLAHARALLTSHPEGTTGYIDADLREPDAILDAAAAVLDVTQPIALLLMGIMGHIAGEDAYPIAAHLVGGLPPGSYLALYDGSNVSAAFSVAQDGYNQTGAEPYHLRSPEGIAAFFDGLELVEPGIVPCNRWRPDIGTAERDDAETYGGAGRKREST
jgi:hypothetical protein